MRTPREKTNLQSIQRRMPGCARVCARVRDTPANSSFYRVHTNRHARRRRTDFSASARHGRKSESPDTPRTLPTEHPEQLLTRTCLPLQLHVACLATRSLETTRPRRFHARLLRQDLYARPAWSPRKPRTLCLVDTTQSVLPVHARTHEFLFLHKSTSAAVGPVPH